MRPLRVASALLLRSSHGRCVHTSIPAFVASLPNRLLSSGRATTITTATTSKKASSKTTSKTATSTAKGAPNSKQVRHDYRGKSAKDILEFCGQRRLETSDVVKAFFNLGKAVRGEQRPLVTRTRSDPACADLMRTLQLQSPSLRGQDVSNTWLGVRDLRVSESRVPSDLQFMHEL
eukprot:g81611.t1